MRARASKSTPDEHDKATHIFSKKSLTGFCVHWKEARLELFWNGRGKRRAQPTKGFWACVLSALCVFFNGNPALLLDARKTFLHFTTHKHRKRKTKQRTTQRTARRLNHQRMRPPLLRLLLPRLPRVQPRRQPQLQAREYAQLLLLLLLPW